MHRTILPFLSTFLLVVLCVSILAPHRADAIVVVVPLATVSLAEIFMAVLLFVLIPASLVGVIIRLLGGQQDSAGKWHVTPASLASVFLKYCTYHVLLVGGSLAIVGFFHNVPRFSFFAAGGGVIAAFASYFAVLAVVGPYVVYGLRHRRDARALAPSVGSHLRLFVWNMACVLALHYLYLWMWSEPYLTQSAL